MAALARFYDLRNQNMEFVAIWVMWKGRLTWRKKKQQQSELKENL